MKKAWLSFFSVLLLTLGSSAWAANIDLGTIDAGEVDGDALITPTGPFEDEWQFTLTETLDVGISFDSNDNLPFFEITAFQVTPDSGLISLDFDAATNSYLFQGILPAGVYTFDVTGDATGSLAGNYQGIVGAAVVPIPAAAWLFGSALLGLASIRRRKTASA